MEHIQQHIDSKGIVVLGSGESGVGAAILASEKGYNVFVSDSGLIAEEYKSKLNQADIPFEEGQHSESRILTAGLIIKSPGIPQTVPLLSKLREQGVPVLSEIEFAIQF